MTFRWFTQFKSARFLPVSSRFSTPFLVVSTRFSSRNSHVIWAKYLIEEITNLLDYFSKRYEHFIILGDFNETISNKAMASFMQNISLKSLVNLPTCYKTVAGRSIDLVLTNRSSSFQKPVLSKLESAITII